MTKLEQTRRLTINFPDGVTLKSLADFIAEHFPGDGDAKRWNWKDDYEDRDSDGRQVAGVFRILDYVIAYAYWNYHTKNCIPTGSWDVEKLIKKRGE